MRRDTPECCLRDVAALFFFSSPPLGFANHAGGVGSMAAGGLVACLEESDEALQTHALRGLLKVVDEHWAEVSASISRIEAFAEDDGFAQRSLASLLASKARRARGRPARRAFKPNGERFAGVLPPGRAQRVAHVRAGRGRAVRRERGVGVCDHAAGCGAARPRFQPARVPDARPPAGAQPRLSTSMWSCAASPRRWSRTRAWWPSWSACSSGARRW
jgi:hypothetical protein